MKFQNFPSRFQYYQLHYTLLARSFNWSCSLLRSLAVVCRHLRNTFLLQFFPHRFKFFMTSYLSLNCICFHKSCSPPPALFCFASWKISSLPPKCKGLLSMWSPWPLEHGSLLQKRSSASHWLWNQWLSFHLSFLLLFAALKSSLTNSPRFLSFLFIKSIEESYVIPLHLFLCHAFLTCIIHTCLCILFFCSRQTMHCHVTLLFTAVSTFPIWGSLMTTTWLKISECFFVLHQKTFRDILLILYMAVAVLMSIWENIINHQHWTSPHSLSSLGYEQPTSFFFYFHCHQLPRVWSFHFYSRYANDFWIVPDYLHFRRLCAVLKCLFLDHVSSLVDLPPSGSACTKNLFLRQKLEYSTSKADHSRFFSSSSIWSMQYRVLPKDKP